MGKGFRTVPSGGVAAPPYTNGAYDFSEDITFNGNLRKSPNRYYLEEFFKKVPDANAVINAAYDNADATNASNTTITTARVKANKDFELLGTNADIADFSWSTIDGGLLLETGSADNDQVIILPHLDTKQTAWASVLWGTENQVILDVQIRTTAVITPVLIWVGLKLTNTPVIATDADQVYFRYDTDVPDSNWQCITSIANTDTTTDSGVTVAVATSYNLRIEIDSDRKAFFYINDVLVHKTAALTNDIDLIPYVGLQQLGSGDSSLVLSYEKISRILFE